MKTDEHNISSGLVSTAADRLRPAIGGHAVVGVRIQIAPDVIRANTEIARSRNVDHALCRHRLPLRNALVRDAEPSR